MSGKCKRGKTSYLWVQLQEASTEHSSSSPLLILQSNVSRTAAWRWRWGCDQSVTAVMSSRNCWFKQTDAILTRHLMPIVIKWSIRSETSHEIAWLYFSRTDYMTYGSCFVMNVWYPLKKHMIISQLPLQDKKSPSPNKVELQVKIFFSCH